MKFEYNISFDKTNHFIMSTSRGKDFIEIITNV